MVSVTAYPTQFFSQNTTDTATLLGSICLARRYIRGSPTLKDLGLRARRPLPILAMANDIYYAGTK
jgi:hypothetical protein